MIQYKNYLGILGLSLFVACAGNSTQTEQTNEKAQTTAVENSSDTATLNFANTDDKKVFDSYLALKDKLVATNYEQAKTSAQDFLAVLATAKNFEGALSSVKQIAEAKDIVSQRVAFTALNNLVIPIFKKVQLSSGTIYVQHCPMANNGDGGDWLAAEKKIQNPYYGDEMMECGAVTEKIKSL